MLDIGWSELFIVVLVALLVIGPKDLPRVIHGLGKWVRKARAAAGEFQRHFDEMVREADLQEVRDDVRKLKMMGKLDAVQQMNKLIDPDGQIAKGVDPYGGFVPGKPVDPTPAKPSGSGPAESEPADPVGDEILDRGAPPADRRPQPVAVSAPVVTQPPPVAPTPSPAQPSAPAAAGEPPEPGGASRGSAN